MPRRPLRHRGAHLRPRPGLRISERLDRRGPASSPAPGIQNIGACVGEGPASGRPLKAIEMVRLLRLRAGWAGGAGPIPGPRRWAGPPVGIRAVMAGRARDVLPTRQNLVPEEQLTERDPGVDGLADRPQRGGQRASAWARPTAVSAMARAQDEPARLQREGDGSRRTDKTAALAVFQRRRRPSTRH